MDGVAPALDSGLCKNSQSTYHRALGRRTVRCCDGYTYAQARVGACSLTEESSVFGGVTCLRRIRLFTEESLAYGGVACLRRSHLLTEESLAYGGVACLRRRHLLTEEYALLAYGGVGK